MEIIAPKFGWGKVSLPKEFANSNYRDIFFHKSTCYSSFDHLQKGDEVLITIKFGKENYCMFQNLFINYVISFWG